jgi:adenosylcobinamide-phosphate synthase
MSRVAEAVLTVVVAYVLDAALGEPPNRVHPVAWMGTAIGLGKRWALRARPERQLARGACVVVALCSVSVLVAYGAERLLIGLGTSNALTAARIVVAAALLKPLFAVRALRDAAFEVRDAIAAGNVERARGGLRSLCSRDPSRLSEAALAAAAIESVAENASDSVVAPLLFFGFFGLPGAAFYRAANTLDAMIGYRGPLERVGKIAARLDDVLNLVPSRLTAALLLVAGAGTGADVRRGLAILRRDAACTASPNAGRPMAAMAGLLGVALEKDGQYHLGDPLRPIESLDITRAWRLASRASLAALGVTVAVLVVKGPS